MISMNLAHALELTTPATVAITGGGGKTTTLFQLTQQLPGKVWASTTTHLGTDQLTGADQHFIVHEVNSAAVDQWLSRKSALLTGDFTADDRVKGPAPEILEQIHTAASQEQVSLLIEADGSRSRPLKAPGENEPATPAWAKVVINVVGLSVLGSQFSEATVHRVEPFKKITGLHEGQPIQLENILQLLIHPLGSFKNCPAGARKIVLFNQLDLIESCDPLIAAAPVLLAAGIERVLIGALKTKPAGILCIK